MEAKHKELLLKDLCARIPYDVKCKIEMWIGCDVCTVYNINSIGYVEIVEDSDTNGVSIERIKPYLFPLSSMTEEQRQEFLSVAGYETREEDCGRHTETYYYDMVGHEHNFYPNSDAIDWLNKNHFDYRGLISLGLAIDATGLNIY